MKRRLLTETPVCPRERLVIISYTTGLSFSKKGLGHLLQLLLLSFIYSHFIYLHYQIPLKTRQHLLLLVGFDTLIYQKYYDIPPILVGHQQTSAVRTGFGVRGPIQTDQFGPLRTPKWVGPLEMP
jgi:hypothetical protein